MPQFPMEFRTQVTATSDPQATWKSFAGESPVTCAIPPEFAGPGGGASPEDLYALALTNCFVATFKVFAARAKLEFADLIAETTLTVERNEKGFPWMSRLLIQIKLRGAVDREKTRELLEKTTKQCMVIESTKTKVDFEFNL